MTLSARGDPSWESVNSAAEHLDASLTRNDRSWWSPARESSLRVESTAVSPQADVSSEGWRASRDLSESCYVTVLAHKEETVHEEVLVCSATVLTLCVTRIASPSGCALSVLAGGMTHESRPN